MLFITIEMRHAPFYGWIRDLSAPDPTTIFNLFGLLPFTPPEFLPHLGVWPLLMGGTMFLQQKMMPTNADPVQQKVFMLLPVIFTVSFLWAPSGLVIYWLVSNMLAIGQQMITNRMIGPAPVPAVAMRGKTAAAAAATTRKPGKPGNGSANKS